MPPEEDDQQMNRIFRIVLAVLALPMSALAEVAIPVTYLQLQVARPPVLSNLDPIPDDLGVAGAALGLADNLTTAKFLGHAYSLTVETVPEGGDFTAAARKVLADSPFVILDAPAAAQLAVADLPEAQGAGPFSMPRRLILPCGRINAGRTCCTRCHLT